MGAYEFTNLCYASKLNLSCMKRSFTETTNLYKQGVFAAGDAFKARSLDVSCEESDLL